MGLSAPSLIRQVQKAFGTLGDVRLPITYRAITLGVYNPTTNERARTVVTTELLAVGVRLTEQEFTWFPADANTQKLLIAAADLPTPPQADD